MMAVRPPPYPEPFGTEADQDANSLLTELDKGLRSAKIGEQCEAIIRFPTLFDKYPFPILINSSFLKLAEFFHGGSNLIRLWVLRVCQQSEKHLEKILNVDQFVKRIFNVIHSNDPVARALTLKTLGAVAGVIPEKQDVHHAIRRALDSHDTVEVEAAIQASVLFAAQSKTFAVSMCSKVSSMIESLQTPISMKLKLIPVLRHMHHDASTAALVKTLCINLLPKYPSESFVLVILDSLTQLSSATLVDIPDQVNLLIQYLMDPRHRVRIHVLKCLQLLAERGAHLWPKKAIIDLISFAMMSLQNETSTEQSLVLSVILALTKCPVTCHTLLNEEVNLELCSACLVLDNHTVASQAMAIMTSLIAYCYNEKISPPLMYLEQINLHLESLIFTSLADETLVREFAQYLKCGVRLTEKNFNFGENFVELIGGLMTDEGSVLPDKHAILMVETLGALCSQFYLQEHSGMKREPISEASMDVDSNQNPANPFDSLLPQLLRKMESLCEANEKPDCHFIEVLSAVCLQAMLGHFMPQRVIDIFDKVFNATKNLWTKFRIARSASRYGHHYLAAKIYQNLCGAVSDEKYYFYLTAMFQISQAECILLYGTNFEELCRDYVVFEPINVDPKMTVGEKLDKAINLYWKALSNLKATSTGTHALTFQTEFVKLRAQFLEALHGIVIVRNTQCITPPPAIAQTLAQNSRDHLQKFGHVTNQLRKTVKTLKICEENYQKLYKSAFDADPGTLEHLEIMQHLCSVLGHSVETICFVTPSEAPAIPIKANSPETRFFLNNCIRVAQELKNLPTSDADSITNKHTDVILAQIDVVTRSSMCLPRFFFQTLQNTSIKLSLTPQPRNAGEPVVVQPGSNLVVKVEGVVQSTTKSRKKSFRQIDSVQLQLVSQLVTPRPPDLKSSNDTIVMNQTVKPHRDFLTGSFLLPFNNVQVNYMGNQVTLGGQWQVSLETCVIDTNGVLWNTGPKSSLVVRVPEDQKIQSFQPAPMRRF
ncbi:integrator complex subunit 7 [Culicoides brevitarsis]|uniref:integrator complex subunit 7 n=1 Tax=Culicoides brevitarsis TaxID=469753 RepID=UPI00307BBBD9